MPVLIAGRPAMSFPSVKKWTIHDPAESTACEFSALEVTESKAGTEAMCNVSVIFAVGRGCHVVITNMHG